MRYWLATFILLSSLAVSQRVDIDQKLLNDPQLLSIVNNYFGCKKWEEMACIQCSDHYYFNEKGICCAIKPQCRTFNREQGVCQACYQGYQLTGGTCVLIDLINNRNRGCKQWKDQQCIQCSQRYYFNQQNLCLPIDDNCLTWNSVNGSCQTCYKGYIISNEKCQIDQATFRPEMNDLCAVWDYENRFCISCAERAYFADSGRCQSVDDLCDEYDIFNGECLTCYKGYNIIRGKCEIQKDSRPKNLGCKVYENDICIECAFRWIFKDGQCSPVNDFCFEWNNFGKCTKCYQGYSLSDGYCQRKIEPKPTDLGCSLWDWENQLCLQCSNRWIFHNGICTPISDQCLSHNNLGQCTSCYRGYHLQSGKCQQGNPFCRTIKQDGTCTSCYVGAVIYKQNCVRLASLADLILYSKNPKQVEQMIQNGKIKIVS